MNSLNHESENIKEKPLPKQVINLYDKFASSKLNYSGRHTKALKLLVDSNPLNQLQSLVNPLKSFIDSVNEQNKIIQEQVEKYLSPFREIEKLAQSYTEKLIGHFKTFDHHLKSTRDLAKPFLDATFRNFKWMVQYLAEKKNLAKKELKEFLRKIFSSYKLNKLQSSFIEFLNLESFGTNPKTSSRLEIFLLIQSLSISR